MVNKTQLKLHLFPLLRSPTFIVLCRAISNWCLCPSGEMTMTRVNSSDLSLFVGGGSVPSSCSASASVSAWNSNSMMYYPCMMQSAFVLMYDILNNNLGLGYTSTDRVHTDAGHTCTSFQNHGLEVFCCCCFFSMPYGISQ